MCGLRIFAGPPAGADPGKSRGFGPPAPGDQSLFNMRYEVFTPAHDNDIVLPPLTPQFDRPTIGCST